MQRNGNGLIGEFWIHVMIIILKALPHNTVGIGVNIKNVTILRKPIFKGNGNYRCSARDNIPQCEISMAFIIASIRLPYLFFGVILQEATIRIFIGDF